MPNEIKIDMPDCIICDYGTPLWVMNKYLHEKRINKK